MLTRMSIEFFSASDVTARHVVWFSSFSRQSQLEGTRLVAARS